MSVLFISDLHLSKQNPALTQRFFHFLQHPTCPMQSLYILGDLFEAWVGADVDHDFHQTIFNALKQCALRGVEIFFLAGNRDFLIDSKLLQQYHCKLIPDLTRINLYGVPILLSHGDVFCTQDKKYMLFRLLTRNHFIQSIFLSLPKRSRQAIASYLRGKSSETVIAKTSTKYDVVMKDLCEYLLHHPAQLIIHGHTHQPCIQLFCWEQYVSTTQFPNSVKKDIPCHFIKRIVLSDWSAEQGNVFIMNENGKQELIYF